MDWPSPTQVNDASQATEKFEMLARARGSKVRVRPNAARFWLWGGRVREAVGTSDVVSILLPP